MGLVDYRIEIFSKSWCWLDPYKEDTGTYECVYMQRPQNNVGYYHPGETHLNFMRKARTWGSLVRLDWLAIEPQASSCYHLPAMRLQFVIVGYIHGERETETDTEGETERHRDGENNICKSQLFSSILWSRVTLFRIVCVLQASWTLTFKTVAQSLSSILP